jgi:hypothetical protein
VQTCRWLDPSVLELSLSGRRRLVTQVDKLAVLHFRAGQENVARPLPLGVIHEAIGALDQCAGKAAGDEATVGDAAEPETHDPDVDAYRLYREPVILGRPVVALDCLAEALGDRMGELALGQVGDEETELVAAEAGMQILGPAAEPLLGDEVVRAHLLAQDLRDALDDTVADGVAERVVVPLEAGDIDEPDGRPTAALLER